MGKKKSWFSYVKKLIIPESKPKPEEVLWTAKQSKNWRWLIPKLKFRQYPAIEAPPPPPPPPPERTLNEAEEKWRKHAMAVAIATSAAAEAAMAAANAAVEVVRLTNMPARLDRKKLHLAAIKIQTSYRGHLARKALSALKGIVKLQAVIRGELVRRIVVRKLALLRRRRISTFLDHLSYGQKEWNKCEEIKERRKAQSLQESTTLEENRSIRINQFEGLNYEKFRPMSHLNSTTVNYNRLAKLKLRTARKEESIEDVNSPLSAPPRRSFNCHLKQRISIGEDGPLSNLPAYMAATESAKAKSRSFSNPKQRVRLGDVYCGQHSPHKFSFSSWSSFNTGEVTSNNKRNSISPDIM